MIIKENKEIKKNGLCRKLVEFGFGDLKVKIRDKEILTIKSILASGNEILRSLLLDVEFTGTLELYEECSEIGFYEMEKYYSGGNLMINNENVSEILLFCLCYKDIEIQNECFRYIKKNMNDDEILLKLIDISNIFPCGLKEIEKEKSMEIERRGYKYLYNNLYLMRLEMNNLIEMLNSENMIIRSENWLLNRLMEWYKNKINNDGYNNNDEFSNEFKKLIEDHLDVERIKEDEISEENKEMLNKLKVELRENVELKYIDLYKMNDENVQNLIINQYDENDEEIEFNKEEKEILNMMNEEEIIGVLKILMEMKNMNIMEIIIMIIIYKKMKIEDAISNREKRDIICNLCMEYKKSKINGILKCLCVFINDEETISMIEEICGKEVLFKIFNEENSINNECKELIKKYILECKLSIEEEEEMSKIISDDELLSELKTKEISSFSYPHSEYSFLINEEMSIIPSFDGNRVEFSITPLLPSGIMLNKENGIIHGNVDRMCKKRKYEAKCKNIKNEKEIKISLEFLLAKFTELNKSDGILIKNNGKKVTEIIDYHWSHCYLNMRMENGIYHIKYQFHQNRSNDNRIMLGLSTNNTYSDEYIFDQLTTCNYYSDGGKSQLILNLFHIGEVVNSNPNFNNHGGGSIYEIIVDMNKREFWISHNNSSPILLVKDLPSPLYPYVCLYDDKPSIKLLSVSHQN